MVYMVPRWSRRVRSALCLHGRHVIRSFSHSTQPAGEVRVRFAPSPTGFMHIGGLRTALMNKLYAAQQNGKFILRIEDTDRTRYHPDALQDIVRSLEWANLAFDEGPGVGGNYGPYFQSERKSLYATVVDELIKSELAYPCFCSVERLELLRNEQRRRRELPRYDNRCRFLTNSDVQERLRQGQPYTVRFKVPTAKTTVNDLVFGPVEFDTQDSEGDFILLKSDGMPVYHLANVVDDHHMEISHVIRGVEWLSSTPKHLLLYSALSWTPPAFAHLPLLLSSTGGKLSKRSPEFALVGQVRTLIQAGYLPSAVITWLSSVGTGSSHASPTEADQPITRWNPHLQMSDLVSRFSLNHISRQNVTISADTLRLCGRAHFDRLATEALDACHRFSPTEHDYRSPELLTRLRGYLQTNLPGYHRPNRVTNEVDLPLAERLHALRGRVSCFSDLLDSKQGLDFLWRPIDPVACEKTLNAVVFPSSSRATVSQFLIAIADELGRILPEQLESHLTSTIHSHCKKVGLSRPAAMQALRICLTGNEIGLPVVDLIKLLTPADAAVRLRMICEKLCASQPNSSSVTNSR